MVFNEIEVEMIINWGIICIKLFFEIVLKIVENFVIYFKNGYYDGFIFYCVIFEFMI